MIFWGKKQTDSTLKYKNIERKIVSVVLSASIISALFSFPVVAAGSWEDAQTSALWNYAFVTLGNFTDSTTSSSGEHAIGPIAVGGDFVVGTYSFADNGTDPGAYNPKIPQLLVKGNATATNANTLRGDLVVSSTSIVTGTWDYKPGYTKVVSDPFPVNFTTEDANMKALSAEIASYSATNGTNITPTGTGWTTAEFIGTNSTLNVFNLDASGGVNAVNIKCPTGSQIIINVTGVTGDEIFTLPNVFVWSESESAYKQLDGTTHPIDHTLLWNFSETKKITSVNSTMTRGAILAPYAAFTPNGGNTNGTIICASYEGSSEIHWSKYTSGFSFLTVPNNVPDAVADTATTAEDTPVTVSVLTNDTDAEGDTLTVTGVSTGPSHGTCAVNASGTITYTPTGNYSGPDTFTYGISDGNGGTDTATVTITITAVNDAPDAIVDTATTDEEEPVKVSVLTNDTDADGDTLTVTGVTVNPLHGTCVVNGDGTITYTPTGNYSGTDTFTYGISDGNGGTDTATVTITIDAVNDAPDAIVDTATTDEEELVKVSVLTNDTDADGDTLTVTGVTVNPLHGTCVVNGDGTITYTPSANYSGTDTFTYGISDGNGGTDAATVTITVTGVSDLPVVPNYSNIISEDTSVTGTVIGTDAESSVLTYVVNKLPLSGTVIVDADGKWKYTPNENFNGTDTFTVIVSDGDGGTAISTITITVLGAGDLPVATDDSRTVSEDTAVKIPVLANDTNADGNTLTVTGVTNSPLHGTCVVNGDGTITYTPNANYSGTDTFTYAISNSTGGTDTATVTITITAVNDSPVATGAEVTTTVGTPASGKIVASDVDGDVLGISIKGQPVNGTITINKDGTWVYTPNAGFVGTENITVSVYQEGIETADSNSAVIVTISVIVSAPGGSAVNGDSLDGITKTGETSHYSQTIFGAFLIMSGLIFIAVVLKNRKRT